MAKFISLVSGVWTEVVGLVTSTGAADAGKIPQLDGSGKLSSTLLPPEVGAADTNGYVASEALSAGDLVNTWNDAGTSKVRKADASAVGKHAHGYVLTGVASGATATVYAEGTDNQLSGLTGADQYLSATTPGAVTATVPSGAGQVVQRVGYRVSATSLNFQQGAPVVLA